MEAGGRRTELKSSRVDARYTKDMIRAIGNLVDEINRMEALVQYYQVNLGPFKTGQLRELADAGILAEVEAILHRAP
jgi:hypothetical protein